MNRRELVALLGTLVPGLAALGPAELEALETRVRHPARGAGILDARQRALVDQLSEIIIPATDTPGARAARVVDFVDVIVGEYYHDDERALFLRGLADVDARAQADFARPFVECAPAQQAAIVAGLDAEARAMPAGTPHFFGRFKGMTLYGYYTSEIGYTQELHGVFMPGSYGDAPVGGH
jgi:hypothetical protein